MPAWVWVLLGLTAFGLVCWRLESRTELDLTDRLGRALAILFILAVIGIIIFSFLDMDWQ